MLLVLSSIERVFLGIEFSISRWFRGIGSIVFFIGSFGSRVVFFYTDVWRDC